MQILSVDGVSFGYDGVPVLKDISFTVMQGDFIGVVGPNGTGKTTLFRLVMGLISPFSGEISLFGAEPARLKSRSRVSYVAQKSAATVGSFPATAYETVLSGMSGKIGLFRRPSGQDRAYALECLKTVGMEDFRGRLIGELSGGQLQRVMIARALAAKPELMLLDEPTIGIDIRSVEDICCLLARLNAEQKLTIVMITHDLTSVLSHANKILVFDDHGGAKLVKNTGGDGYDALIRELPAHRRTAE